MRKAMQVKTTAQAKAFELEDRLNKALEHEAWQTRKINELRAIIQRHRDEIILLDQDKKWLMDLCMRLAQ